MNRLLLGKRFLKKKLVKKVLRSLPPRFAYKATSIRETKDLKRMRLEELMGSLLLFEIDLNEESKERKKLDKSEPPVDEGNELLEFMALLSKNFERVIKRLNTQVKGNPQTQKIAYGTFNPTKFGRTQGSLRKNIINKSI